MYLARKYLYLSNMQLFLTNSEQFVLDELIAWATNITTKLQISLSDYRKRFAKQASLYRL